MNIKFSPPDITDSEINEVVSCLKSGWITTGPRTKEFEKRISSYSNTRKTVCLASATACLINCLRVLGIKEGDEVITTAYTYTATANVIARVGAKIVLCDTQKDSVELDYEKLETLITKNTKAIIPVDIAGKICDYDKIKKIIEDKKGLYAPSTPMQVNLGRIAIIADGAHSFGAIRSGVKSGNFADFTCFSFHAVKNLTTAEGGAVTFNELGNCNLDEVYKTFMLYSLMGQDKDALKKSQAGSWEYDILLMGDKCNMTDISASIGLKQLGRYDEILKRRREIITRYNEILKGENITSLTHFDGDNISSGHLYLTRVKGINEETRNRIIVKMAEKGIATNVHYKPLPLLTAYKNLGFKIEDYPNAYDYYKNEITLPLHTLLTDEEVDYVAKTYKEIVEGELC